MDYMDNPEISSSVEIAKRSQADHLNCGDGNNQDDFIHNDESRSNSQVEIMENCNNSTNGDSNSMISPYPLAQHHGQEYFNDHQSVIMNNNQDKLTENDAFINGDFNSIVKDDQKKSSEISDSESIISDFKNIFNTDDSLTHGQDCQSIGKDGQDQSFRSDDCENDDFDSTKYNSQNGFTKNLSHQNDNNDSNKIISTDLGGSIERHSDGCHRDSDPIVRSHGKYKFQHNDGLSNCNLLNANFSTQWKNIFQKLFGCCQSQFLQLNFIQSCDYKPPQTRVVSRQLNNYTSKDEAGIIDADISNVDGQLSLDIVQVSSLKDNKYIGCYYAS